jgi:16S rRNA (guanine527-N7)-methyltransferase
VTGDSIAAVREIVSVSHETEERLAAYVALIRKWQPAENLVSGKTLPEIWRRHVADSAQLVPLFPETRHWLDIGAGAGFPGMVVAILAAGSPGSHVHLVESNTRKCAFLRQAIRATDAPATVHEGRAEALLAGWNLAERPVERIVARAVAPLEKLLLLAAPLMLAGVPAAFHKGEDAEAEVGAAERAFSFDLVRHASRIAPASVILEISRLRRMANQGRTGA